MLQSKSDEHNEPSETSAGNTSGYTPSILDRPELHTGARGVAVRILTRIEQSDAYLDKLLNHELAGGDLNEMDRRLLMELATGVLRWQSKLDWVLTGFYHGEFSKCIPLVKNALRVALYQILFLDRIPQSAAVHEAVEYIKRLKGERSANLVNAVLRSVIRKIDSITYPDPDVDVAHYLSVMYAHPQWMVRRWAVRYGEKFTEEMLAANNVRPGLTLRVNQLRNSPEDLLKRLLDRNVQAQFSPTLPNFIRATHIPGVASQPEFQEGLYSVQDEAAYLAVRLTEARPGMRLIDLCAAPGGKSTAIAEMMNFEGEVIAVDKYGAKLGLIEQAAERLGFGEIIHAMQGDALHVSLEPADVVLVDAPCSGLGVLSKKPDIKWKRRAEEIEKMARLQAEMLKNAAKMVKPGGHLVYSTCTIEPAENEEIIDRFLLKHPQFELVRAETIISPEFVSERGFLQTYPHIHGMDGAFGARMRRRPDAE